MSELERRDFNAPAVRSSGSGLTRRDRKNLSNDRKAVVRAHRNAKDTLDAVADVTEHGMHRTAELDRTRQFLAGDSKVLHELLYAQEAGYVNETLRAQRSFRGEA
jgi:hypothetical protein